MASNFAGETIEEPKLMSRESRTRSFIKFVNRSRVPVDIVWSGYNGQFVRYAHKLQPNDHYSVDTFVTHPWQVWNSATLKLMNLGGSPVYFPQPWERGRDRTVIYIDEPIHSLVTLCLEKIKSLVNRDNIDELGIPQLVIDELKKRRTAEVQDYMPRTNQDA